MSATNPESLHEAVAQSDARHPHYHYQASWQSLCLAVACDGLGRKEEARAAYKAALFQDHLNRFAREGLAGKRFDALPPYRGHAGRDADFRAAIGEAANESSRLHDAAAKAFAAGDAAGALALLRTLLAREPEHANGWNLKGQIHFAAAEPEAAREAFAEAVKHMAAAHDAYHKRASGMRLMRGQAYARTGELDLAINDFTKALDLHAGNTEALQARAQAYRRKENPRMGEQDELRLAALQAGQRAAI
jgi:tetratricopeptide (TPR) repeat protein